MTKRRTCLAVAAVATCSIPSTIAALPNVDFDRMGKVGLAGSFSGLDLFSESAVAFDATTATLLARSKDGSLSRLASTNPGGRISAGCTLNGVIYFAGSFTSIGGADAANIASYTSSSNSFAALGSGGPNGDVDALYCDQKSGKLWAGGKFSSPGASVAVWESNAWSKAPFEGLTGAGAEVHSITANSTASSLFFSGSFVTSFEGGSNVLNGTNNPNVPQSTGATPFSSSLVPVPLQASQVDANPSASDSQFSKIENILCPAGDDGPGNTWFSADGSSALLIIRTGSALSVSGVRLGNTFLPNHGTKTFNVVSIPDNKVQRLTWVNPTTAQSESCTDDCPLLSDSSVPYQDFLFDSAVKITGVQLTLTGWTGAGAGLHLLQLLSSGAFAASTNTQNGVSCFAPNASASQRTGDWVEKNALTGIAATTQSVLVSSVNVGTASSAGPSFTWTPYVSASGDYEMSMLVPGCDDFQDCGRRTSVKVTVFPGNGLAPFVTEISQRNNQDVTERIYTGPILPSSPDFVTTITMTLADQPAGNGQDGKWDIIADRIQLLLTSVTPTAGGNNGTNGTLGQTGNRAFGFFEWPLDAATVDATSQLSNSSRTGLVNVGIELFTASGGTSASVINAVAHHSSGTIFLAGQFTLSSGSASGASNIVAYTNGALVALSNNGLDGVVTSLALVDDKLFVGGSFRDTTTASDKKLRGVALYDVGQKQWTSLLAGVDGSVSGVEYDGSKIEVVGNFTKVLNSAESMSGHEASGIAVWDVATQTWVNSGGFVIGALTFVEAGTDGQGFIAGNIAASSKHGASGLVMLKNGGNGPTVTPLGVQLDSDVTASTATSANKRRRVHRSGPAAWIPQIPQLKRFNLFARQSNTLSPLPAAPPAPAPAVLAGAFWTNTSSSAEVAIIGGNFSFGTTGSQGLAIYNSETSALTALPGSQVNGVVRALFVSGSKLFVGGEFSIEGTNANGLALYDLAAQKWDVEGLQPLQASSGSAVVVRSISASTAKADAIIVAGSFAEAGSLGCQSICLWDMTLKQWNTLGNGIQGEVSSVAYAGNNQNTLVASGSLAINNNVANVVQFSFDNSSWSGLGVSSDIPGPVTALEVNGGNPNSIFAAGRSSDGSSSFLAFWDGTKWNQLPSTLQGSSNVAQLTMVPLQDTHAGSGVIEQDRMLMVSGSLLDSSFGNASTALYDGASFIPYITSTSSTGDPGLVSSMFRSFATFSFDQKKFLAVGIVILISIAIAAGVVFLLVLIGVLWTLFSRREEKNRASEDDEDDDDSTHHRPSSLLAHINAATRTTIMGAGAQSPFSFNNDKDHDQSRGMAPSATPDQDPFADGGNYIRAETPSEALGGTMAAEEETSRPAHARYSFDGAGEGELPLAAGNEVEILDDRDPAWWYARDARTGREGVIPSAYVY